MNLKYSIIKYLFHIKAKIKYYDRTADFTIVRSNIKRQVISSIIVETKEQEIKNNISFHFLLHRILHYSL